MGQAVRGYSIVLLLSLGQTTYSLGGVFSTISKKEIGASLVLETEKSGSAKGGTRRRLYETHPEKRLLSDRLVDYGGVKLSPTQSQAAFIEGGWAGADLTYRLIVYDMDRKSLKVAAEEKCNFGKGAPESDAKCQIAQFEWVNDSKLRYSFDYAGQTQKWIDVGVENPPR